MEQINRQHQWLENETNSDQDQDQVARRAYQLYQARGGEPGHELEDWLQAEAEICQQEGAVHSA